MVMVVLIMLIITLVKVEGGAWCVARSGASEKELQRGLDYACAAGADCYPLQPPQGLCFLPNTLQAHASYAFNSFFQRSHLSPLACDFSATATIATTDPSYGSCVYPASPSSAGSITSTTTSGTTPTTGPYGGTVSPTTTTTPTTIDGSGTGTGTGFNPNTMGPPIPTTTDSRASPKILNVVHCTMSLFLLLSLSIF